MWVDAQLQPSPDTGSNFSYRLPAPLAADALKLELATDNSLARVQVRSRTGADATWQTRAEFTAFRLRQDDNVVNNDEIAVNAWGVVIGSTLQHKEQPMAGGMIASRGADPKKDPFQILVDLDIFNNLRSEIPEAAQSNVWKALGKESEPAVRGATRRR